MIYLEPCQANLAFDPHAFANLHPASLLIRDPVDFNQAVKAISDQAIGPAIGLLLGRLPECNGAVTEQRGCDGIACLRHQRLAFEADADRVIDGAYTFKHGSVAGEKPEPDRG